MAVPRIVVHFTREELGCGFDDSITISKSPDSSAYLLLSNICDNEKCHERTEQVMILTAHQVVVYLQDIFHLVMSDNDPFYGVQLDLPCAPSILLRVNRPSFKDEYSAMVRVIDTTLQHWPEFVSCKKAINNVKDRENSKKHRKRHEPRVAAEVRAALAQPSPITPANSTALWAEDTDEEDGQNS